MYIIDSHQDLAWNVINFGRDYTRSAEETRLFEYSQKSKAIERNGDTLLGWPDYQRGKVPIVFSTLFAAPERRRLGAWDSLVYRNAEEAHKVYMAQLDVYHRWADDHPDKYRLLQTRGDMKEVLSLWEADSEGEDKAPPVGLVILMEAAEGVRDPEELEMWWGRGVRIIGPAWTGTRFCGGTGEPGPLTSEGYALLDGMASFDFTLDLSHMDVKAALQALDHYPGRIIASHANTLAQLKGSESNRHLPDKVIQGLVARGGVIGVVPFNAFLKVGWRRGDRREEVSLERVVAHIDHICQVAGNALHVGIGSDFDGGFGWQSVPHEIDTIADMQKLAPLLRERGYSDADIERIFSGNWRGILETALPETS